LNGKLIGAPYMEKARGFDREECRLPELRVEIWAGFICVTLNNEAQPLTPRLRGLNEKLSDYRLEEMNTTVDESEVWNANWKMIAENAMEGYHLFHVHKTSIEPYIPTSGVAVMAGGEGYSIYRTRLAEGFRGYDEALAKRLNPRLTQEHLHNIWVACIFPSHFIGVMADQVIWLNSQPLDVSHSVVRFGTAQLGTLPDRDTEEGKVFFGKAKARYDAINSEDKAVLAAVQKGANARHAEVGRLSHLEWPLWEFNRYLARMLAPQDN
jgi:phenylpropionate dioxygenase-like ring-hydroxylating dioxygenase large terminal subunit